jgi:hypothetical protein
MRVTRLSSTVDTLLTYSLGTTPSPLQASPPSGGASVGAVHVVVSNNGGEPVTVKSLTISITIGDPNAPEGWDLTEVDGGFAVEATGGDWNFTYVGNGQFQAVPGPSGGVITTQGLGFTIGNIQVSPLVGTSNVTVSEVAGTDTQPMQARDVTIMVAKFPAGFYAGDLFASATQVGYGQTVLLSWMGSAAATYTLYWADQQADVTGVRAWTSPPLTTSTTFTLVVATQEGGRTVDEHFSVTVMVSNPSLTAHDLTVQGDAGVGGKLTVTGAVQAAQATAGTLTSTGDAGVAGTVRAQAGEVQGTLFVKSTISGTNWIGGGAASIRGYRTRGGDCDFAFKYDDANFGDKPNAIQIWHASSGVYKTFVIDHPLAPDARYLLHATLEGPEGAVYYRGSGRLHQGRAEVLLPSYFEALTRPEGRTVLLTAVDGWDRLAVESRGGARVADGRFVVVSDNPHSEQAFDWEVKAVRVDGPPLQVEVDKADTRVGGFGPYRFPVGGE